ncbi:MAG: hypothetical protein IKI20_03115 [Lachnospiraceae bacterium]|nr:hypothetical protein [Lachnospiraceae bacterium]
MDLTIEYTEEEQKVFYEEHKLREQVDALLREEYVLRREKQTHTKKYNADFKMPMIASGIATLLWIALIVECIKGGIYIAIVTQVLTLTVVTTGMAIYYWYKFFLQNTKNRTFWAFAESKGITNYYAFEWKLDHDYEVVKQQLNELKPKLDAKVAEREAIEEAKYTAPTIVTTTEQMKPEDAYKYFWQGEKTTENKNEDSAEKKAEESKEEDSVEKKAEESKEEDSVVKKVEESKEEALKSDGVEK